MTVPVALKELGKIDDKADERSVSFGLCGFGSIKGHPAGIQHDITNSQKRCGDPGQTCKNGD